MLRKSFSFLIAFTCAIPCLFSDVKMPAVFSDNMVLQRDSSVPVWGWASPGEKVTVDFAGQKKETVASQDGRWLIRLSPLPASFDPRELTVSGNNKLIFKNVLTGDVWLCSGQSNMEMPLSKAMNPNEEIAGSAFPSMRLFLLQKSFASSPKSDCIGVWNGCSPASASVFSGAAYFFGRQILKDMNVPVGLIGTYWGGTPAEAWTPDENLKDIPELAHMSGKAAQIMSQDVFEEMVKNLKGTRHIDMGNKGEALGYAAVTGDFSDWKKVPMPDRIFELTGVDTNGAIWVRKEVEIPASLAGKDLELHLGPVDDYDVTYFNGVKIGSTGNEVENWWLSFRVYKIPGNLVKAGKNVIAVRDFDDYGGGGFSGTAGDMYISLPGDEGDKISIAGDWIMKYEIQLDPKTLVKVPRPPAATPSVLYNAMIAPIVPFAIKGAIWYQGEANAGRAYQYRTLFPAMINAWREKWGQGDFPFLFVQLANFKDRKDAPGQSDWAELREAQLRTLALPNTGMAVIIDIGEANDIHPRNKQDVGYRLALAAQKIAYGKDLSFSGPIYESMSVEGDKIRIKFKYCDGGLMAKGDSLKGFSIAGEDRRFVWANAVIQDDNTVLVSAESVKDPLAVRYAWADNPDCNLYNRQGLPASPFRTDNWRGITVSNK